MTAEGHNSLPLLSHSRQNGHGGAKEEAALFLILAVTCAVLL
jgi:hypothetical protein